MKTFLTIVACVLFVSVLFVPTADAPLSTYILWFTWCAGALWIANLIWEEIEARKEDEN